MATRNVRSKMKDINENVNDFHAGRPPSHADNGAFTKSRSKAPGAKGDYIDFEEIK